MTIDQQAFPFPLSDAFLAILADEIAKVQLPQNAGVTLSFRDPDYSPERGGFHPVEICIDPRGRIQYVTDFAYVGRPPFAELAKEIDFDVSLGLFQHFGREFPIHTGRDLFALWQGNFCSYYRMGVYTVTGEEA
mgnify:CR=1 FL=1